MLFHFIDFLVDFFRNINVKKIAGAILVLIGLALLSKILPSGDPDKGVLYALGGILVGGVGLAVIYHDIAKDKMGRGYNGLELLAKAHKEQEDSKSSAWHMNHEPGDKNTPPKH